MMREQIARALDDGFAAHINKLFTVLCETIASGEGNANAAVARFDDGFCLAEHLHDEALARLAPVTEEGKTS